MGLTGVVVRATIALSRVETAYFAVDTQRTANIDELMDLLSRGDDDYPYSVAWFDSLTTGRHLGRAVLTRGRPARLEELPKKLRSRPLDFDAPSLGTVPPVFPSGLVNRTTGRAFNELWFRKAPAHRVAEIQNITTFFHPLDLLGDWNRLYGPRGFCQYQFVVPFGAEAAFRRCAELIASSGHVSCLNVLKRFGPGNTSPMSFPTPGWTLAVDLPVRPGLGRPSSAARRARARCRWSGLPREGLPPKSTVAGGDVSQGRGVPRAPPYLRSGWCLRLRPESEARPVKDSPDPKEHP